jgi:hypothetical protein
MGILSRLGVVILIATLTACSSDSTSPLEKAGITMCAAGTAILATPPVPLVSISGWVPLGNLNPPGHTFPTDHQYLYYASATSTMSLVAPSAIFITRAKRTAYSTGQTDYSFEWQPCLQVKGEFGHVASLASSITSALGAFDQGCNTYSPNPGLTVTQCYSKSGAVKVAEGEQIGTVGVIATSLALDFSLWDIRITPLVFANASRWSASPDGFDRYHVVPASDYFAEPAKSQIAAKLGSYNGATLRTIPPIGGTIVADSSGIQGHWFVAGQPTFPESPHLAIARDNVDPRLYVFSIGTSQPGFSGGSFQFTPTTIGSVNVGPSEVASGSGIRCYEPQNGSVILLEHLLSLGPSQPQLRLEVRSGQSSCVSQQPYAFTQGKTADYSR